jgi:hypothetical protein
MLKILSLAAILTVAAAPAARASDVYNSSLTQGPGVYFAHTTNNYGFDVVTTTSTDSSTLQLGLEANNRFLGPITPSNNNYLYTPNTGALSNWDFTFSVNSGTDPLSAYSYLITVTDTTTAKSFTFDPTTTLPDNGQSSGSTVVCSGCAFDGSNTGFQNAENLGFSFLQVPLGFSASAADDYTVELSAVGAGGSSNVTINVLPTPEPSSLMLLGTGLVTAIGAARRKFKA